ncbi:uncharacterized protein LOC110847555 [Folsomia candida]|uniref:Uncharacterized protein n=1 Tax=Folsomia candida TaxID=158441 RepID=A0A226ELN7_FOLCA|nr:uncharacterized protein LOC110847555 [Folsomia candida]OXA58603.1 hypothetical protein Fcan01_06735 [Folsomia candida]
MYKFAFVLSLVLVVIISATSAGKTDGKKWKGKFKNMTCKGESMNMTSMFVGQKECYAEVVGTGGTTVNPTTVTEENRKEWMKKWKENELCIEVCKWKKQKMLNDDGTYNADGSEKLMKAVLPTSVQAAFKKAVDECASTNGKSFSLDNKCAGYKAFKDCKVKKFMEICEIKKGESAEEV